MKKSILLIVLSNLLFSDNLTIYNSNFANINSIKEFNVTDGINQLEFPNFPDTIITDSIVANFSDNIRLLEQNFVSNRTDMLNLLKLNLNSDIKFFADKSREKLKSGKLINIDPITIMCDDGYYILEDAEDIIYKNYPKNFSKTAIEWKLNAKSSQKETLELNYLAKGFNWSTNYVLTLNDKSLNLKAFATITNGSGKDFKDANITLFAGKVNAPIRENRINRVKSVKKRVLKAVSYSENAPVMLESIEAKSISNYYKYDIPFNVTLLDGASKQINIIDAKNIKYNTYALASSNNFRNYGKQKLHFNKHIEFVNKKDNALGIAMPKGIIRVYKNTHYLGENSISNTPNKEKVDIAIGQMFDVVGTKSITKYVVKDYYRSVQTKYELRNRGKESATIKIREQVPRYGDNIKFSSNCKGECSKKDESAFVRVYTIKLKPKSSYKFNSSFEIN
jgi:hypothetical protein